MPSCHSSELAIERERLVLGICSRRRIGRGRAGQRRTTNYAGYGAHVEVESTTGGLQPDASELRCVVSPTGTDCARAAATYSSAAVEAAGAARANLRALQREADASRALARVLPMNIRSGTFPTGPFLPAK